MKKKTIAIMGTFDTKGKEFEYVKGLIEDCGLGTLMIHVGTFESQIKVDVDNAEVAKAVGADLKSLQEANDRAAAMKTISDGIKILLPQLFEEGKFDGVFSMGGSGGTSLATGAMQLLPVGVPKVMVSTMASGDVGRFVGSSDILMIPSIVDVDGINRISKTIYTNAAHAIVGMVKMEPDQEANHEEGPLIAATMFGVTTPCINYAKDYLEKKGYEVLVFHATGAGGKTMESLIEGGFFSGVLDLTTTEWNDELFGGNLSAGPHRSEAAVRKGIPQVVSVGAMDMVNFAELDSVPQKYQERNLYPHNPSTTLMRTSVEENRLVADQLAKKLNLSEPGKTTLILPLKGVSAIDQEGQAFYGPEEDKALFDRLRERIDQEHVEIIERDNNINDQAFAEFVAQKLVELMEENK